MTSGGSLKITDFTTAFDCRAEASTNEYMSPELLSIGLADYRSYIYSLRIIAYQSLTGKIPFAASDEQEVIRLKLKGKLKSPAVYRPDTPPCLARFIMKALARDPRKRYQSVRDVIYDLRQLNLSERPGRGFFFWLRRT
jgi:serine/threonine protein kinase